MDNMYSFKSLIGILLLGLNLGLTAQADSTSLKSIIALGSSVGSDVAQDNDNLKFGYFGHITLQRSISARFDLGLGVGLENYQEETLMPLFVAANAFFKPTTTTGFLSTQIGYAFAWHEDYSELEDYDYQGGWLYSLNYGYRFKINAKFAFLASLGVDFQTSQVKIELNQSREYIERVHFLLFSFSTGIQF